MTTPDVSLRAAIRSALPRLRQIDDASAARPRAPGKWSRKQIVGHLIDSASNNHQRFVRALASDDLISPTYDQEAWVKSQRYDESEWSELVALWYHFNLHIAHVMQLCPADARERARARHNLHETAFTPVPASQATTLDYFMRDYVVHLEHHLTQIFE